MSEYELSLMRQRGLAARDSKARRGEFQFMLPPGFCWSEAGRIEIDPDEHVQEAVRMVFAKFRELGSARQVFLWFRAAEIKMPVVRRNIDVYKVVWKSPAYHTVMQILHNPLYAGAYAFGRTAQRTQIVDGRAHKVNGIRKPAQEWSVLLRDHHVGLHQLAGIRGEPEALAGERLHEAKLRSQIGAWRPGAADGSHALRTLRSNDASILRHGERSRASLSMSRRRRTCGLRPLHRGWRRPDRSRGRLAASRSRVRSRRRSRNLRFRSDRTLDERHNRRGGARS